MLDGGQHLRIALVQSTPVEGKIEEALSVLDNAAKRAAQGKAEILITPEMFLTGYAIGADRVRQLAEPADGPTWEAVGDMAKRHQIALLCGGPRRDADGRVYNAVQLRGTDGSPLVGYDKTHLFGDVDRKQFQPGKTLSDVLVFHGWSLGLAICYDIEFPEVARALALKGAEAILAPTANMVPFDSVATRLVPARSEENGLYIAYANYCGADREFDYCGLSCLTGPDGRDIARAGRKADLIFGDLSKEDLAKARTANSYLQDRRADLYPGSSSHE